MANYPYMNYQGYPPQGYQQNMGPVMPPQQQGFQIPQGGGMVCRPVSSRAEAEAFPADFMGAPMYFPDMAQDKVYMKRWNATRGATDFVEYIRSGEPAQSEMGTIRSLLESLTAKVDDMSGGEKDE